MRHATHFAPDSHKIASLAFLHAYKAGRPINELAKDLPTELEATGQHEAAEIVRSFFSVSFLKSRSQN